MSDPAEDAVDAGEVVDQHEQSAEDAAVRATLQQLQVKLRTGANWFYWIAGLSVVNWLILLAEGDRQFVVGLGITQVVNGIAVEVGKQNPDFAFVCNVVAGVFTCIAATVFAAFGIGSRRRLTWVFICGIILYTLDGLLLLLGPDLLSFGFHIFALVGIFGGFKACRQLNSLGLELADEGA